MTIEYTGTLDAACPITLAPVQDIELPVAFRNNTQQPYEAAALAKWLEHRHTDPVTNMPVEWTRDALEIIAPLSNWCRDPGAARAVIAQKTAMPVEERGRPRCCFAFLTVLNVFLWTAAKSSEFNAALAEWHIPCFSINTTVQHVIAVLATCAFMVYEISTTATLPPRECPLWLIQVHHSYKLPCETLI